MKSGRAENIIFPGDESPQQAVQAILRLLEANLEVRICAVKRLRKELETIDSKTHKRIEKKWNSLRANGYSTDEAFVALTHTLDDILVP